jgi:hypothetical protein
MRATIILNIVVQPDEEVTMGLLLERAKQLEGLTIHDFQGLSVHDAVRIPGLEGDRPAKLVRYSVDCEGPAKRIKELEESSSDFVDDYEPPRDGSPSP